jgi:hypothetical protein
MLLEYFQRGTCAHVEGRLEASCSAAANRTPKKPTRPSSSAHSLCYTACPQLPLSPAALPYTAYLCPAQRQYIMGAATIVRCIQPLGVTSLAS